MDSLFDSLRPFIHRVIRHAWLVLLVAGLLSAAGLYSASNLRVDTDLAKLLPSDYESVQALEKLRETVGGETTVDIAIESPSYEANKRFAEALIPRVLELTTESQQESYFTHVDYYRNTEFLENNALYFASSHELDQVETYLEEQIEQAKLEANPFYFDVEDDDEEAGADTMAASFESSYNQIVGKEYPVSDDSTTMVLRFYPSGSQTNVGFIEDAYNELDRLVEAMEPSAYHSEMEVTLAGRLLRQLTEVRAITRDVLGSFGAGVGAVLLVVMLYFLYKAYRARAGYGFSGGFFFSALVRAPVMAFVIGLPLLMSLTWTFGVAYWTFGTLNLMTSALGLVLFGLGIDFGIHFYARYTEERGEGRSMAKAVETTFNSTGQAITVGALTTAAALFVLTVADFKGFSEFGFIAGTGIVFALIAMTLVMPALLVVLEETRLLDLEAAPSAERKSVRPRRFPAARGIILGSLAAVTAALVLLPPDFEYDFGKLEPEYEQYYERQRIVDRVYGGGDKPNNPAYVVVDDREEVSEVMQALRQKMEQDTLSPTIHSIESLQERFPLNPTRQQAKLERIASIRELLDNKFLQQSDAEGLERLRRAARTQAPIDTSEVPDYLKERYTSKSGEIGNFVVIYPSVGLSDGQNSIAFAEDVGRIVTADGDVHHASSTSIVAADMLRLMQQEAPWMIGATFLIVAFLMWVNFRSVKWAGLALLPLAVGILWMLLVMEILGVSLNFYNLVVLPAVLGIGNDAGVHLVHRYREEGIGSLALVMRSTGEHVTVGSLTTMIGFAGLLLSFHPGLESIGVLAVIGISTTLLSALLFLPALLQWLEEREKVPPAAAPPSGDGVSAERTHAGKVAA